MIEHLLRFFVSPNFLVSHFLGVGLLTGLFLQGVGLRRVLLAGLLEEVIIPAVWSLVPESVQGLGVVFTLYTLIKLYERLSGPRVKVQDGAAFLVDDVVTQTLESVSLQFERRTENERLLLYTDLQYAEHWLSFWGGSSGRWAIDVNEVRTVDEGWDGSIATSLRNANIDVGQCFCVLVGEDLSVTCAAKTTEIRDQWVEGFHRLLGNRIDHYKSTWVEGLFEVGSVQADGNLQRGVHLEEVISVLRKVGRPSDKPYVKDLFHTFAKISASKSAEGEAILTKANFGKFIELALKRPEIHQVYERLLYKKKSEVALSPQRLRDFLSEEQKEKVELKVCKGWITQWETVLPYNSFSSTGFTSFMLSDDQSLFNRAHRSVYQDMNQPLPQYFIATSHNTYLTKDQLKGKSSVDAYVSAFKKGCKCVELDCWDGPNNEPIIYHGHTLTSKILFKDVIVAIRDFAFVVSDFPVILSFENHCSIEQQKVMASHLTNILGDKLYQKPLPENEDRFPSPNALKGFVIVKAKKLKEGSEYADDIDDESDDGESDSEENDNDRDGDKHGEDREKEQDKAKVKDGDRKAEEHGHVNGEVNGEEQPKVVTEDDRRASSVSISSRFSSLMRKDSRKKKPPKIAQELSDLVFYCQAVHFKGFQHSKETSKYYEMSSFSEKRAMRLSRDEPVAFLAYSRRQLARIYPAGSRVDSSNYDPLPLWNAGCQMVALNYQTPCKSMQLNQGLFRDNGGCGYVLKPEFMRLDNAKFDPRGPFEEKDTRFLMIRVISGIQLPYSNENKVRSERNLQVQVQVRGVDADNQKEKTKMVKNNGYNPMWNEMIGFKLHVFEVAMVTFYVREGDSLLGQFTLPARSMQQGYRKVPLQNKSSDFLPFASLFVHIEFKDPSSK